LFQALFLLVGFDEIITNYIRKNGKILVEKRRKFKK